MKKSLSEIRSAARADLKGRWGKVILFSFVVSLVGFVYVLLQNFFNSAPSIGERILYLLIILLWTVVFIPMDWSYSVAFLKNHNNDHEAFELGRLFDGYKEFKRIVPTYLLQSLFCLLWFVLFLPLFWIFGLAGMFFGLSALSLQWLNVLVYSSFLLIPAIPLCICLMRYAMTPYVLKDNPELSFFSAIDKSTKMMKGNKTELFMLYLSFVGWPLLYVLLCIIVSFLGMFYLVGIIVLVAVVLIRVVLIPYINASVVNYYEQLKEEERLAVE